MVTKDQLTELLLKTKSRYKNAQLMVHNGFMDWSYGSPLDPIYITFDTALNIMNIAAKRRKIDPLFELRSAMNILTYAEEDENDILFKLTMNNRFLCLYEPDVCKFQRRKKDHPEVDFDLSELL